ncbi:MAG TPA: alpha/beta hydrolase [Gemmatimonadaceae bacterium]|jgi:pimeloyl-ACP methyl ester carboxylesterase
MKTETFDVTVGDHTLRVQRLSVGAPADAPTLVFLHDSLGSIALWKRFPATLADALKLDAIVFDRRGYGDSSYFPSTPRTPRYLEDEAAALGNTLSALGIASAILFGHSDGGSIALIAAALFPERILAVITEGAHVYVEDVTLAGIREAQQTLLTTNLREKLMRYHGDRTDGVTSAWIDTWLMPEYRDWNIEAYLPRVTCPVLAIQGADDKYGTAAQVQSIVEGVAGDSQALIVDGVGHTPHRDAADVVLRASIDFLSKHDVR